MTTQQPNPRPTIMVVGPHPDDAEVVAGATIARFVDKGSKVILVVCTNGDKGTEDPKMTSPRLAEIREREQKEAAKALGVHHLVMLGFPDQGLFETDEFREKVVRAIRQYKPDFVFTIDPNRPYINHPDHRACGRVTLDAVYPMARDTLPYPQHLREGLTPHKVRHVYLWGTDNGDSYFDVSDYLDVKFKALFCHRSQFGEQVDESRMAQRTKRYEELGQRIGVRYAEGFKHIELQR